MVAVTDCKSWFDCLTNGGPENSRSEKRLTVDIVGLQDVATMFDEENPRRTFSWVPSAPQFVDGMTKTMPTYKLRELLRQEQILQVEGIDEAEGES